MLETGIYPLGRSDGLHAQYIEIFAVNANTFLNSVQQAHNELVGPNPCIADSTTLCIDAQPGDKRFMVQVSFGTSQGGGSSSNGRAIPLSGLGVTQGGLFWFFSASNPELLVKILDGCALNQHWWLYASAGTNVGVRMTVTDTTTGAQRTYLNPDLSELAPIQDTSAFATCP